MNRYRTRVTINRAQPTSGYAPVAAIDPGPDGVRGTSDDRPWTVYERIVPAGTDNYLTNLDNGEYYDTIEVNGNKRFANGDQIIVGMVSNRPAPWGQPQSRSQPTPVQWRQIDRSPITGHSSFWVPIPCLGISLVWILDAAEWRSSIEDRQFRSGAVRQSSCAACSRHDRGRRRAVGCLLSPEHRADEHPVREEIPGDWGIGQGHTLSTLVEVYNIQNASTIIGPQHPNRNNDGQPRKRRADIWPLHAGDQPENREAGVEIHVLRRFRNSPEQSGIRRGTHQWICISWFRFCFSP